MAQENRQTTSVWDRFMSAAEPSAPHRSAQTVTIESLKASVARDLEALLNTRVAIPEDRLDRYPKCRASVLNYGVRDFAGMCLTSSEDRKTICDDLKLAIQRYEPRLRNARATVVLTPGVMNRLDFVIVGTLNFPGAAGRVEFNASLQPSTLHYSITPAGRSAVPSKAIA